MRGSNSIRISKKIDTSENGQQELAVFESFVTAGLAQFKGINFEATLEIREISPSKKS